MADQITIAGEFGPTITARMLLDDAEFLVRMSDGDTLTCVLTATSAALPEAPTLTATAVLAGRVLTLTRTGSTGIPAPSVTPSLIVNGSAVSMSVVTPGSVWAYTFPDAATVTPYVGSLTAENGVDPPAVFTFSGSVPASVAPPVVIDLAAEGVPVTAQAVYAGQTAAAAFPAGVEATSNYQSSAGTIASAVRQVSINGAAWTATLTTALDPGQTVAVRVLVTDSADNTRLFPSAAGDATVALALPVPSVTEAPVITAGARVGQTPTVTAATWAAIPGTPAGMAREIETRLTVDNVVVTAPLGAGTEGGELRAEARARHSLSGKASAWSAWAASAPVVVVPVSGEPLNIVVTPDGELEGTGSGPFSVELLAPSRLIGGPYVADQSDQANGALIDFENAEIGPVGIVKPVVSRVSGSADVVGEVYRATKGVWLYDADDIATLEVEGQWWKNGTPIPGATERETVHEQPGVYEWVETITGAGATRTMTSNEITIEALPGLTIFGRPDGIVFDGPGSIIIEGRVDGLKAE